MLLFFSVARSQELGHGERADGAHIEPAPVKPPPKPSKNAAPSFAPHMPVMSSAFDTAALAAAA
ncbi:MAG: hypothetical protein L6Q75_05900 [Burkholderiaceae bacterium]|nr:hypothetical protein [Burkholderiaceae bacterium]